MTLQTVTQDLRFDSGDLQNDNSTKISFCGKRTDRWTDGQKDGLTDKGTYGVTKHATKNFKLFIDHETYKNSPITLIFKKILLIFLPDPMDQVKTQLGS